MKNLLLVVLVVGVIALLTNPGSEKHEQEVIEQIKDLENFDANIATKDIKQLGALLGEIIGLNTLESYANKNVNVKDLKVCSLTQMKLNGSLKTVGIGAFGKVWMLDDLNEWLGTIGHKASGKLKSSSNLNL